MGDFISQFNILCRFRVFFKVTLVFRQRRFVDLLLHGSSGLLSRFNLLLCFNVCVSGSVSNSISFVGGMLSSAWDIYLIPRFTAIIRD